MSHEIPVPDFERYSWQNLLSAADASGEQVNVAWADGSKSAYHGVWLRDNCACSLCVDPTSRERLFSVVSLADSQAVAVEDASVCPQGGLKVTWKDKHQSHYHPGWLRYFECGGAPEAEKPLARVAWDSTTPGVTEPFDAEEIMHNEEVQRRFLEKIMVYGIALITNVQKDIAYLEKLSQKAGLLRDMNWGKIFEITVDPKGEYVANRSDALDAHSDAATREYMPGLQIFQCVENNCEGGESFWVDGLNLFHVMKEKHYEQWKALTEIPWTQANRSLGSHYRWSRPVFTLDDAGDLLEVRDTTWLREPLRLPSAQIKSLYDAYITYTRLKADRSHQVERKLVEGDVAMIDNRRVLHGRRAINAVSGTRHIRTCYSEREELLSSYRMLQRKELK